MSKNPPDVDVKQSVLAPEVMELADKLRKAVHADRKSGEYDKDKLKPLYVENLPETVTVEHVKAIQKYNTNFTAASGIVFGEDAIATMSKAKTLDRMTACFPMVGRDTIEHTFERERKSGGDGPSTFGVLSTTMEIYGAGTTRGELKKVCSMLSASALEAFGNS